MYGWQVPLRVLHHARYPPPVWILILAAARTPYLNDLLILAAEHRETEVMMFYRDRGRQHGQLTYSDDLLIYNTAAHRN